MTDVLRVAVARELASVSAEVARGRVEPVTLGAHMFAWAEWIWRCRRDPDALAAWSSWTRDPVPGPGLSLEGLTDVCASCADESLGWSWAERLAQLLDGLAAIDRFYRDDPLERRPVVPHTDRRAPTHSGPLGRVLHWRKPPSAMGALRDEVRARIPGLQRAGGRFPPQPELALSQALQHLAFAWEPVATGSGVAPVLHPKALRRVEPLLARSGDWATLSAGTGMKIALCPLPRASHPLFALVAPQIQAEKGLFYAKPPREFADMATLLGAVEALIGAAEEAAVNVVVLPELMVPPAALARLREILQDTRHVYGVVAGSFHVWREPDWPHNRLELLGTGPDRLLSHNKRGRFRLTAKQIDQGRRYFPGLAPGDQLPGAAEEGIVAGSTLQILDCPLGRVACIICKDAIEPPNEGFQPEIVAAMPDLVFISAMSPQCEDFLARAADWADMYTGTFFVNAHPVVDPASDEALAFFQLPWPQTDTRLPVRVRWTPKSGLQQWSFHKPKDWISCAAPVNGPAPVSLLAGDLGLVVDLKVFWKGLTGQDDSSRKRKS